MWYSLIEDLDDWEKNVSKSINSWVFQSVVVFVLGDKVINTLCLT